MRVFIVLALVVAVLGARTHFRRQARIAEADAAFQQMVLNPPEPRAPVATNRGWIQVRAEGGEEGWLPLGSMLGAIDADLSPGTALAYFELIETTQSLDEGEHVLLDVPGGDSRAPRTALRGGVDVRILDFEVTER